jgi:hypothetical protein
MFQKLLFAMLFTCQVSFAQTHLMHYIEAGDELDTLIRGDLNKDDFEDVVMVIAPIKKKPNTIYKRDVMILLQKQDGTYEPTTEGMNVTVGINELPGYAFTGVSIKNGVLIIEHIFPHGGSKHLYRFQNGDFYLIGASSHTEDTAHRESIEYNLNTGKYVKTNTVLNPESTTTTDGYLKPAQLPKFSSYKILTLEVDHQHI